MSLLPNLIHDSKALILLSGNRAEGNAGTKAVERKER